MKNLKKVVLVVSFLGGVACFPLLLDAKMLYVCPSETFNLEDAGVATIYGGCYPAVTVWGHGKCTFDADFEILGPGGQPCGGLFGHTYEVADASTASYFQTYDYGGWVTWGVQVRVRGTYAIGYGGFEFGRNSIDFSFYAYFHDSPFAGKCSFDC